MSMGNKNKRPVYLNLFKLRLPVTGVVSIVHRITGLFLVLLLPPAIYLLQLSLQDREAFDGIVSWFSALPGRLIMFVILWLFLQHFFSGIRHLLQDIDIGVGKSAGRVSARLTFIASAVIAAVIGVRLL